MDIGDQIAIIAAPFIALMLCAGVVAFLTHLSRRRHLRSPHRLVVVIDQHTYRRAAQEADDLAAASQFAEAWRRAAAICAWLDEQQAIGSPKNRAAMAAHLELWTARRDQYRQSDQTNTENGAQPC